MLESKADDRKPFRADIYPGFGWDHLRFMEMSPVFSVSNYNDSTEMQSCVQIIPILEDRIQLESEVFDAFNSRANDYASNFVAGGGFGVGFFKISGSFSKEYRQIKTEQGRSKMVTIRNEYNHVLADVVLETSCPINPKVKEELILISNYLTSGQTEMASYAAQIFVARHGTHFTSRIQLGGALIEEDFFSSSEFYSNEVKQSGYKAAAGA